MLARIVRASDHSNVWLWFRVGSHRERKVHAYGGSGHEGDGQPLAESLDDGRMGSFLWAHLHEHPFQQLDSFIVEETFLHHFFVLDTPDRAEAFRSDTALEVCKAPCDHVSKIA